MSSHLGGIKSITVGGGGSHQGVFVGHGMGQRAGSVDTPDTPVSKASLNLLPCKFWGRKQP